MLRLQSMVCICCRKTQKSLIMVDLHYCSSYNLLILGAKELECLF